MSEMFYAVDALQVQETRLERNIFGLKGVVVFDTAI